MMRKKCSRREAKEMVGRTKKKVKRQRAKDLGEDNLDVNFV